jgi:stage V sporulation protein B
MTILPVILSQTLYNLNAVVDRTLFNNMYNASEKVRISYLGIYAKYVLMVNIPVAIATALGNSIVPVIVRERVNGNIEAMNRKIDVGIKFNMLIAIPSTVGLAVLAPNIMKLLFPSASAQSIRMSSIMLAIGSVAVAFYALSTISNAILQAMNYMRYPLIHSAIAFILHLGIIVAILKPGFILKEGLGIYSLAIGNVSFAFIVCLLNARSISKKTGYKQEVKKTFVIPTLAALIMGLVAYGVAYGTDVFTGSNVISTLVAIILAVIAYLLSLIVLKGITKEELMGMPKGKKIYRFLCKIHLMK